MQLIRLSCLGLLASFVFFSCQKDVSESSASELENLSARAGGTGEKRPAAVCSEQVGCNTMTKTLFAGQTINVGDAQADGGFTITKEPDGDLALTFTLGAGVAYELDEVHVYVGNGTDLGTAPGQYPYKAENLPAGTKTWTITVPAADVALIPTASTSETGVCYVVAAHAAISGTNGAAGETAWACGEQIDGTTSGSWAMKFTFCTNNTCTPIEEEPLPFCALSQGYWLANTGNGNVRDHIQWDVTGDGVADPIVWGSLYLHQTEVVAIFPAKNNTNKKAIFQAAALYLDVEATDDMEWSDVNAATMTAYNNIKTHFSGFSTLIAAVNSNPTAAQIAMLKSSASAISDFIKANHCERVNDAFVVGVQ